MWPHKSYDTSVVNRNPAPETAMFDLHLILTAGLPALLTTIVLCRILMATVATLLGR